MRPDRWPEIESLYHGALARPTAERGAYLNDACTGDAELRADVQSLLDQPASAFGFLSTPAADLLARLTADPTRSASTVSSRRSNSIAVSAIRVGWVA